MLGSLLYTILAPPYLWVVAYVAILAIGARYLRRSTDSGRRDSTATTRERQSTRRGETL